jgi:hypothetical protein
VTRRPSLLVMLVDPQGQPVAGAQVEVCTESNLDTTSVENGGCVRRALGLSDRRGTVELEEIRELDISCGKEQHHRTVLVGCTREGLVGFVTAGGAWPAAPAGTAAAPRILKLAPRRPTRDPLERAVQDVCASARYESRRRLPGELLAP